MLNIEQLKDMLKQASDGNAKSIREYKQAKEYYSGKQLPSDVEATLKERGQPPIYENLLAMIMEKIKGYKGMARQEMEVVGRQREDRDKAAVLSDILKSISDTTEFLKEKRACDSDLLLGLGVLEVWIKELKSSDSFGKKEKTITMKRISPECFLIDPYSLKDDASDAKFFIKLFSMDFDDAKLAFGSKANELKLNFITSHRKRVNIYEFWVKEIKDKAYIWNRYIIGDTDVLLKSEISPFKNGSHPFAIQKYAIDHDNNWYGFFRNLKPQIDFINFAENRMANMIGSSKVLYEADAVEDAEEFAKEINIDNSVARVKNGALSNKKIQITNNQPQIANLSAKIADARATVQKLSGLNDETLGFAVTRLSGSAIEQRNNAGTISLQTFLIASEMIDKIAFTKAVELITHYFDAEQVFRISEKDNANRYFVINERLKDENGNMIVGKDGKAIVKNKIEVGYYDISLHSIPANKTKREDLLKSWGEIVKTIAPIKPEMASALIPIMLRDTDSTVARDVEEMMAQLDAQQTQNQDPMAMMQMQNAQLDLELKQAKIAEIKANSLKKVAEGKEEMSRAK
ncbi:hypothetical protein U5B43_02930 [Campylobacter sp. 9BO]|uniref:portal protein n=1 Tax=Campylobacter sp. 9BO TaxID=3424759 RepID=UPI003D334751